MQSDGYAVISESTRYECFSYIRFNIETQVLLDASNNLFIFLLYHDIIKKNYGGTKLCLTQKS